VAAGTAPASSGGAFLALVTQVPLAAGFEAVFALHVGVERIGRYLQVFHEDAGGPPAWERHAMAFGPPSAGGRVDPLFSGLFAAAAVLTSCRRSWPIARWPCSSRCWRTRPSASGSCARGATHDGSGRRI
jgi:hypothetical protein